MIKKNREIYTFRGASPEQVADLCDLWQESVVESNPQLGIVRVESDRLSVDQFLMFYELSEYLAPGGRSDTGACDPKRIRCTG